MKILKLSVTLAVLFVTLSSFSIKNKAVMLTNPTTAIGTVTNNSFHPGAVIEVEINGKYYGTLNQNSTGTYYLGGVSYASVCLTQIGTPNTMAISRFSITETDCIDCALVCGNSNPYFFT